MTPSDVLDNIVFTLDAHVRHKTPLPLALTTVFADALRDLQEAISTGEAACRALLVLNGDANCSLAGMMPDRAPVSLRPRVEVTLRDGNVVHLPVRNKPSPGVHLSGCFFARDERR